MYLILVLYPLTTFTFLESTIDKRNTASIVYNKVEILHYVQTSKKTNSTNYNINPRAILHTHIYYIYVLNAAQ